MARRRLKTTLAISLFPFLSILACVMGILTLLIAALAIGEIATPPNAGDPSEPALPVSHWVERIAQSSRSLSHVLEQRSQERRQQALLRDFGLDPNSTSQDVARHLRDRARITELASHQRAKLAEVEEIHEALQIMKAEISRMSDLPLDTPIEILPSGLAQRLAPFFVEVGADGLRIRKRDGEWSAPLNLNDLHQRGRFKVFLENVRSRGNATAIFLVRPRGVENFLYAKRIAIQNFVRFGKLAIPGEGPIQFNLVQSPAETGAVQ